MSRKMYAYRVTDSINCDVTENGYVFINDFMAYPRFKNLQIDSHFITREVIFLIAKHTNETEWLGSMFYKEFENDFDEEPSYNVLFNPLNSGNWYLFSNQERFNRSLERLY